MAAVALASGVIAAPAAAQDTRAAEIASAQAAKAQALRPYEPGKAERIAADVKKRLLETPDGLYPWLDSVYSGGGFTFGGGFRHYYADRTFFDMRGLYSTKAYKAVEFATDSIGLDTGRIDLHAIAGFRDATQVAFYGVGGDTSADAKSNFRLKQAYFGGSARRRGAASTVIDLGLQYEHYETNPPKGSSPSIEESYTPDTAPGLGADPDYVHVTVGGGFDTRPSPGYARHGGLYELTLDEFYNPDGTYTFNRLQGEIVQHAPLLRENWVLSFHGVARTTLDDQAVVPYFLLPSLGSGSTLRGYQSWRFRDRHSLLMSGEWRWIPSRMFMDMAIFYDAGKVTSRREDLNLSDLHTDYGVGIRLHGLLATPLRIEFAHGSEGTKLVFSGAAAF